MLKALLGLLVVAPSLFLSGAQAGEIIDDFEAFLDEQEFFQAIIDNKANGAGIVNGQQFGVFEGNFVLAPNTLLIIVGIFSNDLTNGVQFNDGVDDAGDPRDGSVVINGRTQAFFDSFFGSGNAGFLFDNSAATDTLQEVIDEFKQANPNNLFAVDENDAAGLANLIANQDDQFKNIAIAALELTQTALAPGVFCIDDAQCAGQRDQRAAGPVTERICQGDGDVNVLNECNDFVARFTLSWLLFFIMATYGIFIIWGLYWGYVNLKNRGKGRGGARGGAQTLNESEAVVVNTLAAQCASAENLLFQATDLIKQARNMENIFAVEAKTESKIMIYVTEYFQATCAIAVNLCHQHLDEKTNVQGQQYNAEDATTRSLQLEVLNYVRDRLQLAFSSDAMTDKSLYRIAEAYAVLKKITDSLVFVGFSFDQTMDDNMASLKTPVVNFTEDSLFLGGVYQAQMNIAGAQNLVNQPVTFTMEGANDRGLGRLAASLVLGTRQRDAKIFDPKMRMTKPGVGKALAFYALNQAEGEGLQSFIRNYWGKEIAAMQNEADAWLSTPGALEEYLKAEKRDREARASDGVMKKPRKRRRRRNRDNDDGATQITETTEATGYTAADGNNFVYNFQSVVNSGLGISGQCGFPFEKVGETPMKKGNRFYRWFERKFPNYAAWPKFYTTIFIIIPVLICTPMILKAGKGSTEIDNDGNVGFKARVAGFGTSFLGVPNYYFLDGFVPEAEALVPSDNAAFTTDIEENGGVDPNLDLGGGVGNIFISNEDALRMIPEFNGAFNRPLDFHIPNIQAGMLKQRNAEDYETLRNQERIQETTTVWIYGLMHIAAYFFGLIPLTLIRESLELIARVFPFLRKIYPLALWRDLHMDMGLGGIFFVAFGATVFLITQLVAIGRSTPFAGFAGDPNIAVFFNLVDNVLYIRQFLLPAVPLLLLMKYANRGPPRWMRKTMPSFITLNYWEICYGLHYLTAFAAIIILVIYRPQVFYFMGVTWGVIWGGNKILRILRTRKTTIKRTDLVTYKVLEKSTNKMKRSDVLRITLDVPSSFPKSSRGQACWITVPSIDFIAHPFTLAKVPAQNDNTIMFHIAIRYLPGDDILSGAKPTTAAPKVNNDAPAVDATTGLPVGWKSAVDPTSGQTYYYNSVAGITQWEPPQAASGGVFGGVRALTTRMSAGFLGGGSSRFGKVGGMRSLQVTNENTKAFKLSGRPSWTQKLANMSYKLSTLDPDTRRNFVKEIPIYVSAPLGTSMDDCLKSSLPGSIIITTQNGLPAGESSVRWLLRQPKELRPKFHFFVSVSREVNDALSVVETLREHMCRGYNAGVLDVDGLNGRHAHICDWLGVYIHLTRRKPSTIEADRDALMANIAKPTVEVPEKVLNAINTFIRNRVQPGRLPFDRFLARTQQMVRKRTGLDHMAVGYCGSAKVAYAIRSACRNLKKVHFDGEYI